MNKDATKDELLDYTARHNIEADYTMTVAELKAVIKEHSKKPISKSREDVQRIKTKY